MPRIVDAAWQRWWAYVAAPPRRLASLAAARIVLGIAGVHWYLAVGAERGLLFGQDGARVPPSGWSFATWWPEGIDVLWWVGLLLAAACAVLGGHAVVAAHALVYIAFINRNPLVADSGDRLATCVLPLLACTVTDAMWSPLAARRRARLARREVVAAGDVVHNVALAALVGQVALVYVSAALWKLGGRAWVGGTAVGTIVRLDDYRLWGLPGFVLDHPVLVNGLTWAVIALQAAVVPLLLMARRERRWAIVVVIALAGFHLSTALVMGLVSFGLHAIGADLVLLPERDRVPARGSP